MSVFRNVLPVKKYLSRQTMISHTYQFHLDSNVIHLPDIDDLLGKDVEVVIREVTTSATSNFDVVNLLLGNHASPVFFDEIKDPVTWQKQIRDEW